MWHPSSVHQRSSSAGQCVGGQSVGVGGPGTPGVNHVTTRPLLHFPPPPAYPPPRALSQDVMSSPPSPSQQDIVSIDYSYAYYEPGPVTRHRVPPPPIGFSPQPGPSRANGQRRSRHTYVTRYGTEENIYEEISDMQARYGGLTSFELDSPLDGILRSPKIDHDEDIIQSFSRNDERLRNVRVNCDEIQPCLRGSRIDRDQGVIQSFSRNDELPSCLRNSRISREDILRSPRVDRNEDAIQPFPRDDDLPNCLRSPREDMSNIQGIYGTASGYGGVKSYGGLRSQHDQSIVSLSQSLVEEEVCRVQARHKRVLDELNLSVEAMLMPPSSPSSNESGDERRDAEQDDRLAELLSVGPTDELLSPAPSCHQPDLDSGFSGSSSGASYQSAVGSLRRGPASSSLKVSNYEVKVPMSCTQPPHGRMTRGGSLDGGGSGGKGIWSRKGWKKLFAGNSNNSVNKTVAFDEPRLRSGSWDEAGGIAPHHAHHVGHHHHHHHRLGHTPSQRTISSEESWCSGSEPDLSSDEESDRSASSGNRSNGQLKTTLSKARTLCDKWRSSGGAGSGNGAPHLSIDGTTLPGNVPAGGGSTQGQGRLSRWFSMRRGSTHQYDIGGDSCDNAVTNNRICCSTPAGKMPLLPEVEEETASTFASCMFQQRRQVPPTLPPPPPNLSPQQLKRRHIIAAIVHSENNYVATLQRLVNDYKKPLEESNPPILSSSKISTLFHRLPEILQCHTLFRIALAECIRNWDRDERIGDVFVASFSKAIVLDIYSGFINNFSVAMDLAKMEAKRKSALADFLKVKQISSHDRLSFFGLMVKPVQRFPQFILFLQDLLKHTPQGHHDRMSLQLALTQLESLAEMLNERKREAEQFQAFKEMLRNISGKFSVRPLSDGNRYLLREDNAIQLEFNQNGMITKSKSRRLLLLNDLLVCVSVAPKASDDFGASERLSLKWTCPVTDVEVQDTSTSPTLSRILTAGLNRGGSLKSNGSANSNDLNGAAVTSVDNLCAEMNNLMHDYEVVSRISDLVSTLKTSYNGLTVESTRKILNTIQSSIQRKDEEMAWVDSCCLQISTKNKSGKEEVYTFQTDNPSVKKEWTTELRLAQLALDPCNSPAWEVPEQEQRPSTKMPLYVRAQPVYKSQHQTEVRCGCFYAVSSSKPNRRKGRMQHYLWVCTSDGASSHIAILQQHQQQAGVLKDLGAFDLVETQITSMEFVRAASPQAQGVSSDCIWMGTDSRKLLLYGAAEPEKQEEMGSAAVPAVITQIKYHCDNVFVALGNGSLVVYRRTENGWSFKEPQTLLLGQDPVSSLLPINTSLYAACGKKVWVVNGVTGEIQKSFSVQHEHVGNVNLMAHSGIGLWISLKNSSTVCLYHTETFKHLQDINIASNVMRIASTGGDDSNGTTSRDNSGVNRSAVNVTALMACKGLLWVGTNVGIALTIPLPRLEGVPIISGRVNISYHAHFGPISFLIALNPKGVSNGTTNPAVVQEIKETKDETEPRDNEKPKLESQISSDTSISSVSAKIKHHLTSSPIVLRRRRSKDGADILRLSKTLPRGLGGGASVFSTSTTSSQGSGDTCDVYGLYGELMYIKDYEGDEGALTDPVYESLRRSDPELAAIPGKVSTLDRRLRMKVSRPRSLDLSNWSVESRSSSLYTSSGSEESMAVRNGRSVSRNNSSASRNGAPTINGAEVIIEQPVVKPAATMTKTTTKSNGPSIDIPRRTVITLMGGRGYVYWRQPCCASDKTKNAVSIREPNSNDAHIVIWEMKL